MGQIVIEIPQKVRRTYRIVSVEAAQKLLVNLEKITEKEKKEEDEDILGIWSPPEEVTKQKSA